MSATLQAILNSLQTGSYKAQWNACYALSSLLSNQGSGQNMVGCKQMPLILDQLAHILTVNPNFKVLTLQIGDTPPKHHLARLLKSRAATEL